MAIYYLRESKIKRDLIFVENDLLHHLRNVLRIKRGEVIKFFDEDFIYKAECTEIEKDFLTFRIIEKSKKTSPKVQLQIVQSIIDKSELEDAIRFLVTTKVLQIILVKTERSTNSLKEAQLKRLKEIILNTSEQSEICFIPELQYFENLNKAISMFKENAFVLHFGSNLSLKDTVKIANLSKPITLFVGPEGGFSEKEIEIFNQNEIPSITLKSGVFRSQFAGAIAVLTLLELTYLLN
ncbi:RsmE family RNA methyltransferase [Caldisericum exile]|uniref:Ribosomal RNA small subunit methyltransferase E n=1 Tax=Caldisericum exile (strain DSM 21853 / NBRC 104410 / AZM16c01) TaxID=511051 RepID=A0A7U6GFE9_CALEA|nr:RsmE family RNA methyltransferase [Caldisericum exile]BAL81359.1 hypothetical protein CSE_12330 [Caldisericum exile AZM16c01]